MKKPDPQTDKEPKEASINERFGGVAALLVVLLIFIVIGGIILSFALPIWPSDAH